MLSEMLKPTLVAKQRAIAAIRLPGVTGDSGRRQNSQGIWETHLAVVRQGMSDDQTGGRNQ